MKFATDSCIFTNHYKIARVFVPRKYFCVVLQEKGSGLRLKGLRGTNALTYFAENKINRFATQTQGANVIELFTVVMYDFL
jgi:hypothetical protein